MNDVSLFSHIFSAHWPTLWMVQHTVAGNDTPLGETKKSKYVIAIPPAAEWEFSEDGKTVNVRLTPVADFHGHPRVEVNHVAKDQPVFAVALAQQATDTMLIIKCIYSENGKRNEYRFEGALVGLNVPSATLLG